jgi:Ulp1 family protease
MWLITRRSKQIERPVHCFTTLFYAKLTQQNKFNYECVACWNRHVNMLEMEKIFVPINKNRIHWVLVVIDVKKTRFEYFDAMSQGDIESASIYIATVRRYFEIKAEELMKSAYSMLVLIDNSIIRKRL